MPQPWHSVKIRKKMQPQSTNTWIRYFHTRDGWKDASTPATGATKRTSLRTGCGERAFCVKKHMIAWMYCGWDKSLVTPQVASGNFGCVSWTGIEMTSISINATILFFWKSNDNSWNYKSPSLTKMLEISWFLVVSRIPQYNVVRAITLPITGH